MKKFLSIAALFSFALSPSSSYAMDIGKDFLGNEFRAEVKKVCDEYFSDMSLAKDGPMRSANSDFSAGDYIEIDYYTCYYYAYAYRRMLIITSCGLATDNSMAVCEQAFENVNN